jgi:hypothetical protein
MLQSIDKTNNLWRDCLWAPHKLWSKFQLHGNLLKDVGNLQRLSICC